MQNTPNKPYKKSAGISRRVIFTWGGDCSYQSLFSMCSWSRSEVWEWTCGRRVDLAECFIAALKKGRTWLTPPPRCDHMIPTANPSALFFLDNFKLWSATFGIMLSHKGLDSLCCTLIIPSPPAFFFSILHPWTVLIQCVCAILPLAFTNRRVSCPVMWPRRRRQMCDIEGGREPSSDSWVKVSSNLKFQVIESPKNTSPSQVVEKSIK